MTTSILKNIIKNKQEEILKKQNTTSLQNIIKQAKKALPVRNFYKALKLKYQNKENAVIAEIKKASPSKGLLQANFTPATIAKNYASSGATCLSVLTDEKFFQGSNQDLIAARDAVSLPVLRKDFIISPYQVYESRAINTDCILLIASCLTDANLNKLSSLAMHLSMDILIEVHNKDELKRALKLKLPMIGINNRDLTNFTISLQTTTKLCKIIDNKTLIITESGIVRKSDVTLMNKHNIYCFLVGEALIKTTTLKQKFTELFG